MFNSIRKNKDKTYLIAGLVFLFVAIVFYFVLWYFGFGAIAIPFAVLISIIMSFSSYYFSDKLVLAATHAKPADDEADKKVKNAMEGIVIAAGVPMPRVYIIEDSSLNAFATGRNPQNAIVCVTRGLVEKLDYYQLEGVLAHELAHIKNYDILLATVVTIMVGAVVIIAHMFQRMAFFGGGGRRRSTNEGGGGQAQLVFLVIGLILMILAPIFGQLLKMALSRNREYLADATAIEFTRNPEGLATALEAISGDSAVECADPATASLFIASPTANAKSKTHGGWFSTHPPIEKRIEALRNISSK